MRLTCCGCTSSGSNTNPQLDKTLAAGIYAAVFEQEIVFCPFLCFWCIFGNKSGRNVVCGRRQIVHIGLHQPSHTSPPLTSSYFDCHTFYNTATYLSEESFSTAWCRSAWSYLVAHTVSATSGALFKPCLQGSTGGHNMLGCPRCLFSIQPRGRILCRE